jgi:TPR repeat protein
MKAKWIIVALILGGAAGALLYWHPWGASELESLMARANRGDATAECQAGKLFAEGIVVPLDKQAAREWFAKSAEQGDAEAQYRLAEIYEIGRGVPADYEKSFHWFQESARRGYALAQTSLGMAYQLGEGVEHDYIEAYKWLELAVQNGDTNAVISRSDLTVAMRPSEIIEARRRAADYSKTAPPRGKAVSHSP